MARQLIGESITIRTPEYRDRLEGPSSGSGSRLVEEFVITPERTIKIQAIEIEGKFNGTVVDVCGYVGAYPLIIYLTHPGRSIPPEITSITEEEYGAIELSLERVYSLLVESEFRSDSYLDRLRSFLESDIECKRWIVHPRYDRARKDAERRLESRRSQRSAPGERQPGMGSSASIEPINLEYVPGNVPLRRVSYRCVMCGDGWEGVEPGASACPRCKTHLYRRIIEDLGNAT